jgi:hypothetical protein
MPKSTGLRNSVLDHLFGGAPLTPPAMVYVALYTAPPADDGTGGTEVSGGSYARAAVDNAQTAGNWAVAAGGAKANARPIVFPTASAAWGTITAFALWDAPTGGNMLYRGSVVSPFTVTTGIVPTLGVGNLVLNEV